jgi:hypothetical protein
LAITSGYVELATETGSTLTWSGPISGAGGLLVSLGTVQPTNASNSFTGPIRVYGGTLVVSSDSVLGVGGALNIGPGSTSSGLTLAGNWTTSRTLYFSSSSQVNTNGFDWTVNSVLAGVASTINKTGSGAWILSQPGTLGQNLTSGAQSSTTTVNINGGELRVTNSTGSATGLATVNVGNSGAASLTGTGRIAGVTTIAATNGTLAPGISGIGTLTFAGNLTINGTYSVDANSSTSDAVVVGNTLTVGAASVLNLSAGTFNSSVTYTLAQYGSLSGTFGTVTGLPATHTLIYGSTALTLTPVPEPLLVVLLGLGVVGLRARSVRHAKPVGETDL